LLRGHVFTRVLSFWIRRDCPARCRAAKFPWEERYLM
jgi:hypothetical protein